MEAPQTREVERTYQNMDKLEVMRSSAYGQLALYAYRAIKDKTEDGRRDYQKKIGTALCVLDGIGLLDKNDFILLQDMRYSDLESCFAYVNKKAGGWYEL